MSSPVSDTGLFSRITTTIREQVNEYSTKSNKIFTSKTGLVTLIIVIIVWILMWIYWEDLKNADIRKFPIIGPLIGKLLSTGGVDLDRNAQNQQAKQAEIILFYVDWCPHCKTAKPEWERVRDVYQGKQVNGYVVTFTELNCTNETVEISQMIEKYKIEGYPTIKLIKDDQVIEFDAKPTTDTLTQFLKTAL